MSLLANIVDREAIVLHHDRAGGRSPEGVHGQERRVLTQSSSSSGGAIVA